MCTNDFTDNRLGGLRPRVSVATQAGDKFKVNHKRQVCNRPFRQSVSQLSTHTQSKRNLDQDHTLDNKPTAAKTGVQRRADKGIPYHFNKLMSCTVGVDVGTGSVRAAVFQCAGGRKLGTKNIPISMSSPRPGHYEQSSDEIWQAVWSLANWFLRMCCVSS